MMLLVKIWRGYIWNSCCIGCFFSPYDKIKKRRSFMKVCLFWYKYDIKLKTFDLNTKYFLCTLEFSDKPSSFINESESISGRDLWYTWPKNRLIDCYCKLVAARPCPGHPKWADERQRIIWKFWSLENFLCLKYLRFIS